MAGRANSSTSSSALATSAAGPLPRVARSASRAPPAATSAAGPLLCIASSARSLSLEEQGKLTADEVDIANLDPREGRELIERMFKAVEDDNERLLRRFRDRFDL